MRGCVLVFVAACAPAEPPADPPLPFGVDGPLIPTIDGSLALDHETTMPTAEDQGYELLDDAVVFGLGTGVCVMAIDDPTAIEEVTAGDLDVRVRGASYVGGAGRLLFTDPLNAYVARTTFPEPTVDVITGAAAVTLGPAGPAAVVRAPCALRWADGTETGLPADACDGPVRVAVDDAGEHAVVVAPAGSWFVDGLTATTLSRPGNTIAWSNAAEAFIGGGEGGLWALDAGGSWRWNATISDPVLDVEDERTGAILALTGPSSAATLRAIDPATGLEVDAHGVGVARELSISPNGDRIAIIRADVVDFYAIALE